MLRLRRERSNLQPEATRPLHFFRAPNGRCCFFHPESGVYGTCSEPFFALGVRQEVSGLPAKSLIASLISQFPPPVLANCARELERLQADLHQQSTPPPAVESRHPRAFILQLKGANGSLMSEEVTRRAMCFIVDCARQAAAASVSVMYDLGRARSCALVTSLLDNAERLSQENGIRFSSRLRVPLHGCDESAALLCRERQVGLNLTLDEADCLPLRATQSALAALVEKFRAVPRLLSAEVTLSARGPAPRPVAEALVAAGFQRVAIKPTWMGWGAPLPPDEETLERIEATWEEYAHWFVERLQPGAEHTFPCLNPQDFLGHLVLQGLSRTKLTPQHTLAASQMVIGADGSLRRADEFLGALPGEAVGTIMDGLSEPVFAPPRGEGLLRPASAHCWARFLCGGRCQSSAARCDLLKHLAELAVGVATTFQQRAEEQRQAWSEKVNAFLFPARPKPLVLYFSRGRGAGHATKDIAIAEQLHNRRPDVRVQFVSYDRGADTFRRHDVPVIDLALPENNSPAETQQRAIVLIEKYQPQLVVCHEEFAVPPVARSFGIPCLFITHWFLAADHPWMQMLSACDEIIFIEAPGIFPTPPALQAKTTFVGALVRPLAYTRRDRERARSELDVAEGTFLVLGLPGRAWPERRMPLFATALEAFDLLPAQPKLLIWLADADAVELSARVRDRPDVRILEFERTIDRLMVASDVALTKASYTTMRELDTLGIPSVAVLHGLNPVDDIYARRIPTVLPLPLSRLSPATLADALQQAACSATLPSLKDRGRDGLRGAVQCIVRHLPGSG